MIMEVHFHCFRVSGRERGTDERLSDDFVLAIPAVECAHRLAGLGWIDVRCEEIRIDDPDTEFAKERVARVLYPEPLPAGASPMSDSDLTPLGKP